MLPGERSQLGRLDRARCEQGMLDDCYEFDIGIPANPAWIAPEQAKQSYDQPHAFRIEDDREECLGGQGWGSDTPPC